jgi:hypothetical protein
MVEIYKNYMIVYLDILGFAKKVENTLANPSETLKIASILHKERSRLLNLNKGAMTGPEMKARMFSDTIVLTYPNPDLLAVNILGKVLKQPPKYERMVAWRIYRNAQDVKTQRVGL